MKRELLEITDPADTGAARNGHTSNGTFAKGNRAGASRRSRAAWRAAFDEACSPSDLRQIARRAVRDAKKGDRFARDIVFAYCLQKPPRLLDVRVEDHTPPADMDDPANDYLRLGY